LLMRDVDTLAFAIYLQNFTGIFHRHLNASVPFFAEEQCRLGLAISRYAAINCRRVDRATKFWSFGSAEAPMARAAARHAAGSLRVHCSSENTENFGDLRARPEQNLTFEVGPFYDLKHSDFGRMASLGDARVKYDIIFEHTCFQMHHPDRVAPLQILRRRLEGDGILLIYEKLLDHNLEAYRQREAEKDIGFKGRFFSQGEIQAKRADILGYMEKCQVYLEDLVSAIRPVARYVVMIWKSGNFMGIAASDSARNLNEFIELLPAPFVENSEYLKGLPTALGAPFDVAPKFRQGHSYDLINM
jgi:tRNA (cmo5U34)-methyltransferase